MYAKIRDGNVIKFPYTFGDLRKDNPNVSFPKNITRQVMQKYGMIGVIEGPLPAVGEYQTVRMNDAPTKPVIGQYTEENAPIPELVGEDILANYWQIDYQVVDMFADTTDEDGVVTTKAEHEAAYQAKLDEQAGNTNRRKRDVLLAETDWVVIKAKETSTTLSAAWKTYRQALRDISSHANWPHLEDADWPEKP
jgi:hypothetical protein